MPVTTRVSLMTMSAPAWGPRARVPVKTPTPKTSCWWLPPSSDGGAVLPGSTSTDFGSASWFRIAPESMMLMVSSSIGVRSAWYSSSMGSGSGSTNGCSTKDCLCEYLAAAAPELFCVERRVGGRREQLESAAGAADCPWREVVRKEFGLRHGRCGRRGRRGRRRRGRVAFVGSALVAVTSVEG